MQMESRVPGMPSDILPYGTLSLVAGVMVPVLLIPLVRMTGWSVPAEEIAKASVVLLLIQPINRWRDRLLVGALFGALFGISENFLYLNQLLQTGGMDVFWLRSLRTIPLHGVTVLLMVFGGRWGKMGLTVGCMGAILLHSLFNAVALLTVAR